MSSSETAAGVSTPRSVKSSEMNSVIFVFFSVFGDARSEFFFFSLSLSLPLSTSRDKGKKNYFKKKYLLLGGV